MQILDKYRADVLALLDMANADNLNVVAKAVEVTSRYVAVALENIPASAKADVDFEDTAAVLARINQNLAGGETNAAPFFMPASEGDAGAVAAAPDNLFKVERKLIGAIVGNRFFTEAAVRELDFADGDTVRMTNDPITYEPEITIVERNRSTADSRIQTIIGAVLETDSRLPATYQFSSVHDVHGDVLMRTNDEVPFTFLIKPSDTARLALRAGDIVDLSWYSTEGPEKATVTWVHKDKQGLQPKQKHVAKPKKKAAVKTQVSTTDAPASMVKEFEAKVPFDLERKNVLFVGNATHLPELELIVRAHNGGAVEATDSQKGAQLKHKLNRADVAVLITDEVHHITTNTSVKIAKSLKVPYAVASSDAPMHVERALYRALVGMPAYEPSQGTFEYPEV